MRPRRVVSTAVFVAAFLLLPPRDFANARAPGPVLHEPITADPREDLALDVLLDGDLPAALSTPSGIVPAPDPRQLPRPSDSTYGPGTEHDTFVPDRETRRPEVGAYDDPFTPSTAPYKRLEAFDAVHGNYRLYVRDPRLVAALTSALPAADEDLFYADLVVDVAPDRVVRIPSVGPGARIVRARLGIGATELPMHVLHDGADNWFLQAYGARGSVRARLVMEVVIARGALGGPIADPSWNELPFVAPLPENVARDAALVRSTIGVSRRLRPRVAISKLVEYFRGFAESDDPPRGHRSVYLDLALSKKGVCRHRAFAFVMTAQSLGIPARMITNEAHAWVEVHDGIMWRRIDLGGAGQMSPIASSPSGDRPAYEAPPDAFAWPHDAQRGSDMVAEARARGPSSPASPGGPSPGPPSGAVSSGASADAPPGAASNDDWSRAAGAEMPPAPGSGHDDRPASSLSIETTAAEAHCGEPLRVRGQLSAEGAPCPHVAVELWLRAVDARGTFRLGTLATGDDGAFSGGIVVPADAPRGDYDVIARTAGDARCGSASSK